MTLDPTRAARALAIAVWAACFGYLWLSGDASSYVGQRTHWVVIFGSIALTLTAVVLLALSITRTPGEPPRWRELAGLTVLVAPVLAVLLVPAPSLGALAAAKKSTLPQVASAEQAEARGELPVSIYDLALAARSPDYAEARGIRPGVRVYVTGFVTAPPETPTGEYFLTRFAVQCCAADAIPYSARVVIPNAVEVYPPDQWLQVSGRVEGAGAQLRVVAEQADPISTPSQPYL
jgi:uncharacterized repeat protein (TIGR03943 family)